MGGHQNIFICTETLEVNICTTKINSYTYTLKVCLGFCTFDAKSNSNCSIAL